MDTQGTRDRRTPRISVSRKVVLKCIREIGRLDATAGHDLEDHRSATRIVHAGFKRGARCEQPIEFRSMFVLEWQSFRCCRDDLAPFIRSTLACPDVGRRSQTETIVV